MDISGQTDSEGKDTGGDETKSDPAGDVGWLRNELHRWIYGNVKAKWDGVRRRPDRLPSMFSGYHADKHLVQYSLKSAGITTVGSSSINYEIDGVRLQNWEPHHLHRIVAHFLRVRFQMILALNKADSPHAAKFAQSVREAHPSEPAVEISARGELLLHHLKRAGLCIYEDGADSFTLLHPEDRDLDNSMLPLYLKLSNILQFLLRELPNMFLVQRILDCGVVISPLKRSHPF